MPEISPDFTYAFHGFANIGNLFFVMMIMILAITLVCAVLQILKVKLFKYSIGYIGCCATFCLSFVAPFASFIKGIGIQPLGPMEIMINVVMPNRFLATKGVLAYIVICNIFTVVLLMITIISNRKQSKYVT